MGSCNVFRYCNNNSGRYSDHDGYEPEEAYLDDNPKDDLMPKAGGMVISPSQYAMQQGNSFGSQSGFRSSYGSAGPGKEWHHIVEQWQARDGLISPQLIYNSYNTIALDTSLHREVSKYYSSKHEFTGELTIRKWVAQFPYDVQYAYGLRVIDQIMEKYKE